jgi:hypothetical protein
MEGGTRQLEFAILILLALAGALALAGPGGAPATPGPQGAADAQPSLDRADLLRISRRSTPRVARRVEGIRELDFGHVPDPEVVDSEFLNRLGLREATQGKGGLGVGADDAFGAITGLLGPDERLKAAYESTGDLAAAAYDPETKRLYVVSDAVVANRALVEFVLAHELDHAIEDQNFGLPGEDETDDDQALAETALTEGSATSLMTDYAARNLDPFELLAATDGIDTGTGDVPKAYIDQLTWAYLGGLRFINDLRGLAGSWKLVDYALESRPPASSEQILHPRKYVENERPDPVRIDGAPLRAAGWRPADRNVFGELPTSQLLELGVDRTAARRAAAGWGGDRYELWRRDVAPGECAYPCRSDLALVARWRFDTKGDERQFERAAQDYVERGLDAETSGRFTWRVEGGYAARSGFGRDSALVFAPDRQLALRTAVAQVRD